MHAVVICYIAAAVITLIHALSDCFLLAFIAMASYTAYVFLPGDIIQLGHLLQYLAGTRTEL